MRRTAWFALVVLVTACAPIQPNNRYALAQLDEHFVPESTGARWALAPVALPVGMGSFFVDGLLVQPFYVWDDAWTDTQQMLWNTGDDSRFRTVMTFPFRVVGTPIVWCLDFGARWMLPLENKPLAEQPWYGPAEPSE